MTIVEARKIAQSLRESMAARMNDAVDAFLPTVDRLIAALAPAKRQFTDILDEDVDRVVRRWSELHVAQFERPPKFGPAMRVLRREVSELGSVECIARIETCYREKRPAWAWANGCVPTPERVLKEFDSLKTATRKVGW